MRILTEKTCASISPIPKPGRTAMPLCPGMPWTCSHSIGFNAAGLQAGFSQGSQKRVSDRPINTYYLSWHIHKHEERLGWPARITCHSFRHAFGTHLYENGVDLLTIKALLGHKSLGSTMLYVHLAATRFSDVINPLDKMGGIYGTK